MKIVKCNCCKLEKGVQDNIIISICPICQVEINEVIKDGKERNKRKN